MMTDQFSTLYPVSPLLQQYIYCYYTVQSTDTNFRSTHYSFPHTYNALSIYSGANFSINNKGFKVTGTRAQKPACILQGKRQAPLLVELCGCFSRVTILFKPLGINQFIGEPLANIMGENPREFTLWDSAAFNHTIQQFFTGGDMDHNIGQLENFLLGIYRPLQLANLQQALNKMSDFSNPQSVEEVAAGAGLSLRTFNRLFKKHLGISPVAHQRIARFRHSLENKLFSQQFKKLTDISYQSNFYDQSYFIKLYNQLAGLNPRALFNNIERLGDSKLVFQFMNTSLAEKYN